MTVLLPMDISRQAAWSERVFGPGDRTEGILDHMVKEHQEVRDSGGKDLSEWIDLMILAIDGAWRSGATPEEVIEAYHVKMKKNRSRRWPDWRAAPPGTAIEHIRDSREMGS